MNDLEKLVKVVKDDVKTMQYIFVQFQALENTLKHYDNDAFIFYQKELYRLAIEIFGSNPYDFFEDEKK